METGTGGVPNDVVITEVRVVRVVGLLPELVVLKIAIALVETTEVSVVAMVSLLLAMVVSRVVVREALDAADSVADVVEKIAMALVETGDVSVLLTGAVSPVVVRGALDDAADSVVTADDTVKIPVETTEGIAVLELLSGAE